MSKQGVPDPGIERSLRLSRLLDRRSGYCHGCIFEFQSGGDSKSAGGLVDEVGMSTSWSSSPLLILRNTYGTVPCWYFFKMAILF